MHWTTVAARPKQHWSGAGYTEAPCLSVGWDDRPVRRAVARALVTDRGVHGEVAGGVGPGRVGLDDRVAGPGAPCPPPCYHVPVWAAVQEVGGLPGRIRPASLVENPHLVQRDVRRGVPLHPNGTVGAADEDVEVGGRVDDSFRLADACVDPDPRRSGPLGSGHALHALHALRP